MVDLDGNAGHDDAPTDGDAGHPVYRMKRTTLLLLLSSSMMQDSAGTEAAIVRGWTKAAIDWVSFGSGEAGL